MEKNILKKILPFIYVFAILFLIYVVISFYNETKVDQSNVKNQPETESIENKNNDINSTTDTKTNINENTNITDNVNTNNNNSNVQTQNSSQENSNSTNSGTTNTNKTVKVTSVSLNSNGDTVYINNTSSVKLTATVKPSNASNKTVTWSSSNTSVATVSDGNVAIKGPGDTTIVVKTSDGGYTDQYKLIVKKKIVIVIGASQVTRMAKYKTSYNLGNYNYNTTNGTLVYVADGGTGINFQTGNGFTEVKNVINSYLNVKSNVSFHIFFPIPGNTILSFSCDEISTSNSTIKNYAKNYNTSIQSLKNSGYTVKGYVVSSHPVKVSQATGNYATYVVTNENANACTKGYRSNWKYYQFNRAMKSIVESSYSTNLKYESVFIQIMETNNDKKNFSYKITYNTTDGVHWDEETTKKYVDLMLGYTKDL